MISDCGEHVRHRSSRRERSRAVVLGASHWHAPLYEVAWRECHDVVGVSDHNPDVARAFTERLGGVASDDPRALLEQLDDIDVAYVFGRHSDMQSVAMDLVARHVPFVLEKPGGLNLSQLQDLEAAASRAGVPVTVPLVQRVGPVPKLLSGAGDVSYFSASFIAGPPARYRSTSEWMLDPALAGGGCLANLGVHFVDMFLSLTGCAAERVRGSVQYQLHGEAVEDHAYVLIESADGRAASIEIGYSFPDSPAKRHVAYSVAGPGGFVAIDGAGRASTYGTDGSVRADVVDVDSDHLYNSYVRCVAATLAGGFAGMPGLPDLVAAMRIIDLAYADAGEKRGGGGTWTR